MNPHNNTNSSYNEEVQPPIIDSQERNTNEERVLHVCCVGTEGDNLLATPKASRDESDKCAVPSLSCAKKIQLSPPPLLPSSNNNNNLISLNDVNRSSVLSLPSLDRLDDLQQPVFRLRERRPVNSATVRWRLLQRNSSDPLDYHIQPPQPPRQQLLHPTTTSSSSSLAQQQHLPQLQLAVSHDEHGQQSQHPQQQQHCEEDTEEEEEELIELLHLQRAASYDQLGQQQQQQQQQQRREEGTVIEEDELNELLFWK
jgi:hypothetical protein